MKALFIAFCLITSLAVSAKDVDSMKCTFESNYLNFKNEITVNLNNPDLLGDGPTQDGRKWEIAWSLSECEDSTSITFDILDYKKFKAGELKNISARLEHSEPNVFMEADMECEAL